jgi:hypothetical protein
LRFRIQQKIVEVTSILEDLVGGRAPNATVAERLRESVETTAMLAAEMSSMQRQHASIAIMLKQEEANRAAIESALADMQERASRLSEVEKSNYVLQVRRSSAPTTHFFHTLLVYKHTASKGENAGARCHAHLQEEKLRAIAQRDDFARQLGKDPTGLFPPGSESLPGEQAFRYAEVLEKRMKASLESGAPCARDASLLTFVSALAGLREPGCSARERTGRAQEGAQ